jgi:periodic tryptophan protein 1
MSMITATSWVPRGFAAPFPTKYTFDEEEFARIAELAKIQLDDANEDLEDARKEAAESYGAKDMKEEDGSDDEAPSKTLKSKASVKVNHFRCPCVPCTNIPTPQRRGRRPQGI